MLCAMEPLSVHYIHGFGLRPPHNSKSIYCGLWANSCNWSCNWKCSRLDSFGRYEIFGIDWPRNMTWKRGNAFLMIYIDCI